MGNGVLKGGWSQWMMACDIMNNSEGNQIPGNRVSHSPDKWASMGAMLRYLPDDRVGYVRQNSLGVHGYARDPLCRFFLLTPALGATGLLRVLTGPVTNPMTPGTDVGYPGAMIGSMIFVMTTCSRLITWVWRMACGLCLCGMWCWCGGAVRQIVSTIPEWRVDRSMSAHFAPSCPVECHGSCAHPPRDKCWHCAWARGDGRAWRPGLLRASLVW